MNVKICAHNVATGFRLVVFVDDAYHSEQTAVFHRAIEARNRLCEFWADRASSVEADRLQFGAYVFTKKEISR